MKCRLGGSSKHGSYTKPGEIDPETCDRISTPDFERKYPHDEKYKNVIRFAICRAKKLGWIRQIRRGLWERV